MANDGNSSHTRETSGRVFTTIFLAVIFCVAGLGWYLRTQRASTSLHRVVSPKGYVASSYAVGSRAADGSWLTLLEVGGNVQLELRGWCARSWNRAGDVLALQDSGTTTSSWKFLRIADEQEIRQGESVGGFAADPEISWSIDGGLAYLHEVNSGELRQIAINDYFRNNDGATSQTVAKPTR